MSSSKPKLSKLFLFNPNWGPREGEEEKKIIYFWPPETEINDQVKTVGLVEAVVRFGKTFSGHSAHSLHTQKTRTVWRAVEPEFFLCFTVSVPCVRRPGKEGEVVEYRPEEVSDKVLLGILDKAHQMFSLFSGGLHYILQNNQSSREVLSERVRHFYSRYLTSLKLEHSSVLDMWGGIQYLPLEAQPFLRVQSFINRTGLKFPCVASSLFLQQGQLVWSEICPGLTRLLVHYLTTTLLPSLPSLPAPSPTSPHQGRFLVGGSEGAALPLVHLDQQTTRHLVVYHAINSTLCLLLHEAPQSDFYPAYSDWTGPVLSDLSADLTHIWATSSSSQPSSHSDHVRFIYFNGANFAVKSTVEAGSETVVNLAAELAAALPEKGGETTAKLNNDQWVVVRRSGVRTVIILVMKNLNLLDVWEEVNKLDKTSFSQICLL